MAPTMNTITHPRVALQLLEPLVSPEQVLLPTILLALKSHSEMT